MKILILLAFLFGLTYEFSITDQAGNVDHPNGVRYMFVIREENGDLLTHVFFNQRLTISVDPDKISYQPADGDSARVIKFYIRNRLKDSEHFPKSNFLILVIKQ